MSSRVRSAGNPNRPELPALRAARAARGNTDEIMATCPPRRVLAKVVVSPLAPPSCVPPPGALLTVALFNVVSSRLVGQRSTYQDSGIS